MKKAKAISVITAAVAMAVSTAALAAGPEWTYAEAGYGRGDSSGNDSKNDLWGLRGSYGFMDMWHVQASYGSGSICDSGCNNDLDYDIWTITAGANPHLNATSDLVFDVSYGNLNPDNFDSADIIALGAGIRTMFTDKLELNAKIVWADYNQNDNSFIEGETVSEQIGAQYNWTRDFSTGLTYDSGTLADSASVTLNARYAFKL